MNKSEQRTKNYLNQVKNFGFAKGATILVNFLVTGILLRKLSVEEYGLWSLLISITSWMALFDLGLGNGLRIKIGENLAREKYKEIGELIFFSYAVFTIMALLVISIGAVAVLNVNWADILSVKFMEGDELKSTIGLSLIFTTIMFVLNLMGAISSGMQKTSYGAYATLLSSLIFLMFLTFADISLLNGVSQVLVFQFVSAVIVNIIFAYYIFSKNPKIRPVINLRPTESRGLIRLGGGFLLIQMANLIIFSTDKVLITRLLGIEFVASYDLAYKIFGLLITTHMVLSAPLLPAYTDAYNRKDVDWIKKALKRQNKLFGLFVFGVIVVLILSQEIADIWSGGRVSFEYDLAVAMSILALLVIWINIYGSLLNGIGRLKTQVKYSFVGALLNIPLSIIFVKQMNFKTEGVVLATALVLMIQALGLYVEVKKTFKAC